MMNVIETDVLVFGGGGAGWRALVLEGKTNRALVEMLSNWLHVPKCEVKILRGHTSRNKLVEIRGYTLQKLKELAG